MAFHELAGGFRGCSFGILHLALVALSLLNAVKGTCTDFGRCCPEKDNTCNSTMRGKLCYCDEFCTRSGDCCRDFEYFCRKQDCVPNFWSHWTACSARCARGTQSRTRDIHIPASSGGEPCGQLKQTRACYDAGPHCQRKDIALLLPTYYNPWRNRPNKYFNEKDKRDSYCIRYFLTSISPYCAHDTPWYMIKKRDVICVECHETAMGDDGRCKGSLPGTSDRWHGVATHNCYGTWKAYSDVIEKCTCGHQHGSDFIFV